MRKRLRVSGVNLSHMGWYQVKADNTNVRAARILAVDEQGYRNIPRITVAAKDIPETEGVIYLAWRSSKTYPAPGLFLVVYEDKSYRVMPENELEPEYHKGE